VECVQDHIADVRDLIDEPTEDLSEWSDSRILRHINKEARRLGMMITKRNQDYFGYDFILPLVTDTQEYEIPMGAIRTVEIYTSGVTVVGNGVYTISSTAQYSEVDPTELNELGGEIGEGYYTWGTKLVFTKGGANVTTGYYARVRIIRALPDLLYGTMQSAAAGTFLFRIGGITNGTMEYVSNAYLGYGIKIYNGTGVGQERRISGDSFDGTDHTLTLDSDWGTTPIGTVYFSLTPPFPQEFEDPMVFGGAMRCKIKVEDEQKELRNQYKDGLKMALDLITPRNKGGNRKLRRTTTYGRAARRVVVRSSP